MRDVRAEMQGGDWWVGFLNFVIDTFDTLLICTLHIQRWHVIFF